MKRNWIIKVFIIAFISSLIFSYATNMMGNYLNIYFNVVLLLIVISIGVIFDMIGTASLSAHEKTFHAMSSQKIKGAKTAIYILKNNSKFASICNDIIGDICGIISGCLGAILALDISIRFNINLLLITSLISSFISALTVGGKAIFKTVAIKNADNIITKISKLFSAFSKK